MKDYKIEGLTKTSANGYLFKDLDLFIQGGEHLGLIGKNGAGKSTLLNCIAGKDWGESGQVYKANDFKVSYAKQEPELDPEKSIFEVIYQSDIPLLNLVRRYEEVLLDLQNNPEDEKVLENYQNISTEMDAKDGWTYESTIKTILSKLGITDLDQKVGQLSGGQKKRVGLAQVLIESPDLLLLDEPTNHLDFPMIDWLITYLNQFKGSVLVVSHDRHFLDQVVNRMVDLEYGQLTSYIGNYQAFLEQKAEAKEQAAQAQHKAQQLYKQELAWMRTGAKARTTKQQARINRFEDLEASVKNQNHESEMTVTLAGTRLGKKVLEFENAAFAYPDKPIFEDLNWLVQANERIGIVGPNGAGKSTVLDIIAGHKELTAGTLDIGETVRVGYYQQDRSEIPQDKRVNQYLEEIAQEVKDKYGETVSIRTLLERFMFPKEDQSRIIGSLSGGEQKRLYLLRVLLEKPNVLLLDEPTNDLDLNTLTVLEDFIQDFGGVVMTVSHDRYFVDKIADKLLVYESGSTKLKLFYGSMSDYLDYAKEQDQEKKVQEKVEQVAKEAPQPTKEEVKKMSYHERKEWETIEEEITNLEVKMEDIAKAMNENTHDAGKLMDLQRELEETEAELVEKMDRWEYLASFDH